MSMLADSRNGSGQPVTAEQVMARWVEEVRHLADLPPFRPRAEQGAEELWVNYYLGHADEPIPSPAGAEAIAARVAAARDTAFSRLRELATREPEP